MKKATAEQLKVAREQRAVAKAAADQIAARLGDTAWNEATDGPALETETRNLENAELLVTRLTDH